MNLEEFKQDNILKSLNLDKNIFKKIYTFIDFGNINHWFDKDIILNDNVLKDNEKLEINIEKLFYFLNYFSIKNYFYYGINPSNNGSIALIKKAREFFNVKTKIIQKIRDYIDLESLEIGVNNIIRKDNSGNFIYIPKCNFDVELSIDSIKYMKYYDTFCILSSDSDFIELLKYLKQNKKKAILIKSGFVKKELEQLADLVINGQDIKKYITHIKCKNPAN